MFTTTSTQISRPNAVVYFAPIVTWFTALTGGGATHFDTQDVANLATDYVLGVSIGVQPVSWWKLRVRAGENTDGLSYVVPLGDLTRVWVRVG